MNVFDFKACLEDPANFAHGGALHCLDAVVTKVEDESIRHSIERHAITPDQDTQNELAKWLQKSEAVQCSNRDRTCLRLIALDDPRHVERLEQRNGPLLVGKEVYDCISTHFDLSPFFVVAALNSNPVQFQQPQTGRLKDKENSLRFVFRTYPATSGRFCLGLSYNPDTMQTTAFVSGIPSDEIQALFASIEAHAELVSAPMLIPTILTGFALTYIRDRLYHCHKTADTIKDAMGLARNLCGPCFRDPAVDNSLQLSQSLTTIFSKLAKYKQHLRSLLDLFQLLDAASQRCLNVTPEPCLASIQEATASTRTMISVLACAATESMRWTDLLHERANSYVSMIYNLIAQRDNWLNNQLASATLKTAEATRSDNLAMKAIAEDSRIIANESKFMAKESLRKNDSMRSIAVVTMLFLPATFIATLFSTTFFNFQSGKGPIVSHWIWLYFIVTIVITAAVQFLWFLHTRRSERMVKALDALD